MYKQILATASTRESYTTLHASRTKQQKEQRSTNTRLTALYHRAVIANTQSHSHYEYREEQRKQASKQAYRSASGVIKHDFKRHRQGNLRSGDLFGYVCVQQALAKIT